MNRFKQTIQGRKCTLFKQDRSPFFNLRVMIGGRRRQFSTGETAKAAALSKAGVILADLKSRGLNEAVSLHSRRLDKAPFDPTLEEFTELYEQVMAESEYPPAVQTRARYAKSLRLVGAESRLSRIRALTPAKVDQFKGEYQAKAIKLGRDPGSVRVSLNSILRNCAALFSRAALAGYANHGLAVENPFAGKKLRRVKIEGYSPLKPETLATIWKGAALLRDGNPQAPEPQRDGERWGEPDLREPHPEAYMLLLLELGLGLRRHEADKAQWDWIFQDRDARLYIEVKETPYFIPKSKERRVVPLAKPIYEALQAFRSQTPFIVPGRQPKTYAPGKEPSNLQYRCDQHHRTLAFWLRQQGVADGKPCHVLRKQFGAYVATTFSLYHAQKFLGHSTPQVTADYYAALTELPEVNNAKQIP